MVREKANGNSEGVSSLDKSKEFKFKTLKNAYHRIPLPMYDLTGEASEPLGKIEADKEHS